MSEGWFRGFERLEGTAENGEPIWFRRREAETSGFIGRVENPFVPQTATVSITGEVGRESYSTVRRFLDMGSTVPADAVKIEELLNYFNFSYEEPGAKDIFHCSSQIVACPWNPAHRLMAVRVSARKMDIRNRPPCNLVLLIDASGSMDMPNKLPLIKSGIRLLVDNLRDIDTISVVEFGRQVQVLFAGMPGSERMRILRAVEGLRADGPSPGLPGMKLAYAVARQQFIRGGNNRVILLTDGDLRIEPPAVGQDLDRPDRPGTAGGNPADLRRPGDEKRQRFQTAVAGGDRAGQFCLPG